MNFASARLQPSMLAWPAYGMSEVRCHNPRFRGVDVAFIDAVNENEEPLEITRLYLARKAVLLGIMDFLSEYGGVMLGSAAQTSRVDHVVHRLAQVLGCKAYVVILSRHFTLSLSYADDSSIQITSIFPIPHLPFDFNLVHRLNRLSWEALDEGLTLEQIKQRYAAVRAQARYKPWVVLLAAASANAAFCKLFNGDAAAMAAVFGGTFGAFFARQKMGARHMDVRFILLACAFLSSLITACLLKIAPSTTPAVALATSVLFLVPGVPMLNCFSDILEGHTLMGISRFMNISVLIACITLGLTCSLAIAGSFLALNISIGTL